MEDNSPSSKPLVSELSVSVVIPTYNSSAHIGEAINSVSQQTHKNIEIIVIDDGSTDNTKNVLGRLIQSEKIRYQYQKNRGQAAARNVGVALAQGKYITFLDADDVWAPTKIEKQLHLLTENPLSIVHTRRYMLDGSKDAIGKIYSGNITRRLILENFIVNSSVMGGATIFKENHLDENPGMRAVEDYDLWLRLSLKYKFVYIDEALTGYRLHVGQSSNNYLPVLNRTVNLYWRLMWKKEFLIYFPFSAYRWLRLRIYSIIKKNHAEKSQGN